MTIGLAAGFDPDLAHSYGDIIGSETATLGQHVLEGPGVFSGSRRDRHGQALRGQ
jgi:beta-glucosidase